MQVILLERVAKLGQMGEVVNVKPGFARNYLLPQKKALTASEANIAQFEGQKAQLEARNLELKKEAEAVGVKSQKVSAMAADAQADLDKALPAFESAVQSLKSLSKSDLVEVKGYAKPPALVQKVMEAVCVMLERKKDWDSAKKVLGDPQLMEKLVEYDKDHIPPKV